MAGHFMNGVSGSTLMTVGMSYIDDSIPSDSSPLYTGTYVYAYAVVRSYGNKFSFIDKLTGSGLQNWDMQGTCICYGNGRQILLSECMVYILLISLMVCI